METKEPVASTSRDDTFVVTAGVTSHGEDGIVGELGLKILAGPDQVVAIKIDHGSTVETAFNPCWIALAIVTTVSLA